MFVVTILVNLRRSLLDGVALIASCGPAVSGGASFLRSIALAVTICGGPIGVSLRSSAASRFTSRNVPSANPVAAGASMEDSVLVLHLIARAIPFRFPNVKYVVPHFGGLIPMQLNRLDNQMPAQHPDLPEKPSVTARRLSYDTVGHGSQAALTCAYKAFGAEHLVTGTDYPFLMDYESYTRTFAYITESDLPAADIDQVLHRSAATILGLQD